MPSTSKAQQHYFGMVEAGKLPAPKGMNPTQVKEFASTPSKGLPARAANRKTKRRAIAAMRAQ